MIIKSLSLKPFAGIADKKVEFSSGLNMILGPNEAGKSSLLNALKTVLFVDTDLTRTRYEKEIRDYMPAHGGDIVRVNLNFQVGDNECWLEKEWKMGGKGGSCLLRLGNGVEYTDDNKVSELIRRFLPAEEGTIRNILLTWQSSLGQTRNIFNDEGKDGKEGRGVRTDLGNILRDSIMETDGISVDRLKERLDFEYKDYFSHWDIDRERPENDRGISNPYVKEVGNILRAYYDKEEKNRDHTAAIEIEEEIDRLNVLIKEKEVELKTIEEDLNKHQPIRSKIHERQQIESDLRILTNQKVGISKTSEDWIIQENWLCQNADSEIKKLEERIAKLEKDRDEVKVYLGNRELRKRFARLKELHEELQKVNEQLSKTLHITREDVSDLEGKNQEIREIEKVIEASKLRLSFNARTDQSFISKDAAGQKEEHLIEKGQSFEKIFQGKLALEHKDWILEVAAGEGEIDTLIIKKENIKKELADELEKVGVISLDGAKSENIRYEKCKVDLEFARKTFQDELDEDDYTELEKQIENLGEEKRPSVIDTDELTADIAIAIRELKEIESKKEDYENNIKQWQEEYQTKDDLLLKLATYQLKLTGLEERLKNLPELPEQFEDYQSFFNHVDSIIRSKEMINNEIFELRNEKADKEREKPEQSAEELGISVREAEQNFERVYKEGKAIALIKDKMNVLLKEIEENPYKDFQDRFKKYFLNMSGDSFVSIEMEGDFPKKMIKPGGAELSYELLSFGTKDTFALALRLAMADYFLEGKDGFLVLDDPLVEMDKERLALAAEQINEFSKTKQVIFLTCHEHTANLLKGNRVKLQ
jgi:exonuclease SbcC